MQASRDGSNARLDERLSRALFEAHPNPTWFSDADGTLTSANKALRSYSGLSEQSLLTGPEAAFVHADDVPVQHGAGEDFAEPSEVRLRRHDGQYRWFQLNRQALREGQELLGWITAATDIHDTRAHHAEREEQHAFLQSVIDDSSDCIKVLDLDAQLLSMNAGGQRVMEIDDFSTCRLAFWPAFWQGEARGKVERALSAARAGHTSTFEGFTRTFKGTPRWWDVTVSPVRDHAGNVRRLLAVSRDITERKRSEELLAGQTRLLERIAKGAPLAEVLTDLVRFIEAQDEDGPLCSVLRYEAEGRHLYTAAAPSLPAGYNAAINGVQAGPNVGSCGTAVFTGQPVFTHDIASDPNWVDFRDLALQHDLHACWSLPVISHGGEVYGTFAMYYREPRLPSDAERQLLSVATRLAQVAFERDRLREAERLASEERDRSAALLDAFFTAAPVGFGFFDTELRFRHLNGTLAAMNGFPVEQHLGRHVAEVLPGVADSAVGPLQRVLDTGEALLDVLIEGETPATGRETRQWSERFFPVRDASGAVIGVGAIATDVTEELASQRAVEHSEDRFRSLVDATAQIVWMTDASGLVREPMPTWTAFTGVPTEELLGAGWLNSLHADDRAATDAAWRSAVATRGHYEVEYRVRRHDGEYRLMHVRGVPVLEPSGEIREWVGTCTDITERRQAEAELRDSQARLRFALDAAGLGDWVLDLRDHSAQRSLRHDAIFGYPEGHPSWTYETFLEHVVPEDRAEVDAKFRHALEHGDAWDIECRVRRADGEERWIWTRARTLRDQDGHEHVMLGIVGDITNLKRAEAEVRALNTTLEERVERRTQALEAQTAALDAFVAYTEAVGTATETRALARQALHAVQARFSDASVAYYEAEGDVWKAREWTSDMREDVVTLIRAGVPATIPLFAHTLSARQAYFVDGWDPQREQVEHTDQYEAGACYPLIVGGDVRGLLAVGLKDTRQWSERDKSLVRAVGRSLNLALERAHQGAQLATQNAELEARTRALEGFASLTRDLTLRSDPVALVRRAQEVIMSMLPEGHAAYFQLQGSKWRVKSIVGEWGSPALEAAVRDGLPFETTRNFIPPWTSGLPHYQDVYDANTDNLGELVRHFNASAVLPVKVNGEAIGVLAVALFHQRSWTATEKAVLESVVRSLGLAIEGAQSLSQLAQRTRELERSNRDLEQFAYVASHDLQEPLRTVTSYTELLARRYQGQLDPSADKYIQFTVDAAKRMRDLVQDLLAFSRVRAENQRVGRVDTAEVMQNVVQDLAETVRESGAQVTWAGLPALRVDPVQFRQLLQNLVGNAIKFRREGVTPTVHVTAQHQGPSWHFEVRDNGIGIEPQYFERIFAVFQRLHTRDRYQGTGMGLAICKRIVERCGGQLWLESRHGEGSTFHFTLPAEPQPTEVTDV